MAAEILNKLRELQERNAYPMHMPGHKRVVDFIPFDSREFDYTEIEGLDNLHHPDGIIKTAHEMIAVTPPVVMPDEKIFFIDSGN